MAPAENFEYYDRPYKRKSYKLLDLSPQEEKNRVAKKKLMKLSLDLQVK
jgi:hypothetical protein